MLAANDKLLKMTWDFWQRAVFNFPTHSSHAFFSGLQKKGQVINADLVKESFKLIFVHIPVTVSTSAYSLSYLPSFGVFSR